MNRTLLATTVYCLFSAALMAQDCSISFVNPAFGFRSEPDMVYGEALTYDGDTVELALTLFKPVGDGQLERPLAILLHGGWFENGDRQDMYAMCETLARSGWAAAAVSYRQQFYGDGVHPMPWAYDSAEVGRTIYRAMQDVKGAVRFLKGRHDLDSTSTGNILLAGFTAGAFAALEAAYLTEPGQKPGYCGTIGDVVLNAVNYPRPDLGPVEGDLNLGGFDASVLGVMSFMGAITEKAWITGEGPALYLYHQSGDPMVACDRQRPYWGMNLSIMNHYPLMDGSCSIDAYAQGLNFTPGSYMFNNYNGSNHVLHAPQAVFTDALTWGRNLFCPMTVGIAQPEEEHAPGLFPNPTNGLLQLARPLEGAVPYTLRDAMGRTVHGGQVTGNTLDLGLLPDGVYWLHTGPGAPLHGQRVVIAH